MTPSLQLIMPPHVDSRVNVESIDHVESHLKSTLVSAKVIYRYLLVEDNFGKYLKVITLDNH